jgi:hypothetical protein
MGICFSRLSPQPTTHNPQSPTLAVPSGATPLQTPVDNSPRPGQGPRANQDSHRAQQLRTQLGVRHPSESQYQALLKRASDLTPPPSGSNWNQEFADTFTAIGCLDNSLKAKALSALAVNIESWPNQTYLKSKASDVFVVAYEHLPQQHRSRELRMAAMPIIVRVCPNILTNPGHMG